MQSTRYSGRLTHPLLALVLGAATVLWSAADTPLPAQGIAPHLPGLPDLPDRGGDDGAPATRMVQTYTRGDVNDDGASDVSDAIRLLTFLFGSGEEPSCLDAADVNTDRAVDVSDVSFLLSHLFSEDSTDSFPTCGSVPSPDSLGCASSGACPVETVYEIFFETGEETSDRLDVVRERLSAAGFEIGRLRESGRRDVQGRLRFMPTFNRGGAGFVQNEAIIVADELRLGADTELVLAPEVRHFTILVNRLSAAPGSVITWSPDELGIPVPWGANTDPVESYDPDHEDDGTRAGTSASGGDGPSGRPGRPGFGGFAGPTVEIWALEIDGLPEFHLPGQDGGQGGRGQNGRDGGNGSRGLHSASNAFNCMRGPGRGGDGGDGGDGGLGGQGGRGGDGGQVVIGTLERNILDVLTTDGLTYDLNPGDGGRGGLPGYGGAGGRGGRQGAPEGWCHRVDGRDGRPGASGSPPSGTPDRLLEASGLRGPSGASGDWADRPMSAAVITRATWQEMFDKPQIETIDPATVEIGTETEIHGANFDPADTVFFGDTSAVTEFVSNQLLLAAVPSGVDIGEVETRVRTDAGVYSNPFFVLVRPSAQSVEVKDHPGQTPRLGDVLVVSGSGFDRDSLVVFRGETIEPERVISSSTLEVRLPRPGGAYEEMGGPTSLTVVSPSGIESAEAVFQLAHVLDTGFDPTRHAFGFKNAYDFFRPHLVGRASRSVFEQTYGAAEVIASYAVSPVLTEAYYQFFLWFFNVRKPGLSSAFAMVAVDQYWSGQDLGANTVQTCPPSPQDCLVDANWERQLTIAAGHVLSGQNLHAIAEQALRGIQQGEIALTRIESMIRSQIGRSPGVARRLAPVAMTVPTGPISTNLTEKLAHAHGLLPIAIEYPSRPGDDFEARVYFYNNWYDAGDHGDYSEYMTFHRSGAVLDYEFVDSHDGGIYWSSRDEWTLAVLSLEDALLTDVDLPLTYVASLTRS